MIVFGVGNFNFGIKLEKGEEISAQEYASYLEKELYKCDYVQRNSVVINFDDSVEYSVSGNDVYEGLSEGEAFPTPNFFSLKFEILLPPLAHKEIVRENPFVPYVNQLLTVHIEESFYGNVAFVSMRASSIDDAEKGSDAVILLREFLERQLKGKVYFEYLGPSPIHNNFVLERSDKFRKSNFDRYGFLTETHFKRGYDDISVHYDESAYSDDEKAFEIIRKLFGDELAYVYFCQSCYVQRLRAWQKVEELYELLIEKEKQNKGLSRLSRIFKFDVDLSSKLLDELTSFEILSTQFDTLVNKGYQSLTAKDLPLYLKALIDKYFNKGDQYPSKQIFNYLEFYENRTILKWQTIMLTSAGLLGGVVGSIVNMFIDQSK